MKRKELISAIVLFLPWQAYSQCANESNVHAFSHSGVNYEVVREAKTWQDAVACAAERDGFLVEINDAAEQNAIYDAIINGAAVNPDYSTVVDGGGIGYVWIGATDQGVEGTWIWDGDNNGNGTHFWTGEGVAGAGTGGAAGGLYNNWGGSSLSLPREPDDFGSGQDYGAIALAGWPRGTTALGKAGEWNDIMDTSKLYFVIEKKTSMGLENLPTETVFIYPNPTDGVLEIAGLDFRKHQGFELYDAEGSCVLRSALSGDPLKLDISHLPKGLYFVHITGFERIVRHIRIE